MKAQRTLLLLIVAFRSVSAFASTSSPSNGISSQHRSASPLSQNKSKRMNQLRQRFSSMRGGSAVSASTMNAPTPARKIRIEAFDSMRFFLIALIVLGHFVSFANPSPFFLRLFSQHNVVVGAFFALSGYVTAYTATDAQTGASPKLDNAPRWILGKVFGYFPLHFITLLLFLPVFLYADVSYNGWPMAALHGLLSATMTQAWAPMHAEVWNAPTWFLSALTFCTALMPFGLPRIASMDKKALKNTAVWLTIISLLPKLGYCYDFNAWTLVEGMTPPKAHPNLAVFNMHRFGPLSLAGETFLGAVACRLVMLDGTDGAPKTSSLSTLAPLASLVVLMLLRASGSFDISDLLFRTVLFIPLFLKLLMATHRITVQGIKDPTVGLLRNKLLVALGNLSFPIYIVHGPIGQIFYKKIIATRLFGQVLRGPQNFGLYLLTTLGAAYVMQQAVMKNDRIKSMSKDAVNKLSSWM